ncbi:hypothetical protein JRQ81_013989, partial [Phrynocephalus forsythii]
LWISLEEHQDALELIMSKYRKHMLQLMVKRKEVDAQSILKVHQTQSVEIESQIDRICEMGEVMRRAVHVDNDQYCKIQEKLAQLEAAAAPSVRVRVGVLLSPSLGRAGPPSLPSRRFCAGAGPPSPAFRFSREAGIYSYVLCRAAHGGAGAGALSCWGKWGVWGGFLRGGRRAALKVRP